MNKFTELFDSYATAITDEEIQKDIDNMLASQYTKNNCTEVYKQCLNCIDLTSLNATDTDAEIRSMVEKVNTFHAAFPHLPLVGAICVYPSMVQTVKNSLTVPIGIASVAAGFPSSQTFIEIKVAEVAMAIMEGATEIDVVISIGKFLEEKYQEVYEELSEIKAACRGSHLKVIIESGALPTATHIMKASLLAMASGADFIKTSTGKIPVAATLEATYIMCHAIKQWYEKTGQVVSFKPAGGIVTTEDAVKHYTLVKEILGEEWLNNTRFRIGASRLANNLLSSIEGKETKWF